MTSRARPPRGTHLGDLFPCLVFDHVYVKDGVESLNKRKMVLLLLAKIKVIREIHK